MKTFTLRSSNKVLVAAVVALSLGSAVATVTLVPQLALAADGADSRSLTVHYSDLNMNTEAGVASLYSRIRHAAEQVCGKVDTRRLDEVTAAQACVNQAIASSVNAVGNAQLDREYMARVSGAPKLIYVASTR
jgi:UrcA family protein